MKKPLYLNLIGGALMFGASASFGQFVPPEESVATVMVDNTYGIVSPARDIFINKNFEILKVVEKGGILGESYNGLYPAQWKLDFTLLDGRYGQILSSDETLGSFNTPNVLTPNFSYNGSKARLVGINQTWLQQTWHNPLTAGTGIVYDSGATTYYGKIAQTAKVDYPWLINVIKDTAFITDSYQIFIDTTPSVNPGDPTTKKTASSSVYIDFANYSYSAKSNAAYNVPLSTAGEYKVIEEADGSRALSLTAGSTKTAVATNSKNIGLTSNMSVCFTFRVPDKPTANMPIIRTNNTSGMTSYGWDFHVYPNTFPNSTLMYFYFKNVESATTATSFYVDLSNSRWVKMCMVVEMEKGTAKIYADGVLKATRQIQNMEQAATGLDVTMSNFNTGRVDIKDVRIFKNKALNAGEITAYQNGAYIGNTSLWLSNNIDSSTNTWYDEMRYPLNHRAGEKNTSSRSLPFTVEYEVPMLTAWSDGEFKVMDTSGNLVYWVSTQDGKNTSQSEYKKHASVDSEAKIWFTIPEGPDDGRKWILFDKTRYSSVYEHAKSLSTVNQPFAVGGIIIEPNLKGTTRGGRAISSIFPLKQADTPSGYSYVFLKCSPDSIERGPKPSARALWRPYNALSNATQKAQ